VGSSWAAGFSGAGVNIFFHDNGVDVTHPDMSGKHVVAGSSLSQQEDPTAGDHGTPVASLALGAANNSHCGVGVAYDATFSMSVFGDDDKFTAGVDGGIVHVHSNSWGYDSCEEIDELEDTVEYWVSNAACPFDSSSDDSPCVTCAGQDWSSSTIGSSCVESIS
jgi:subtilisin family serine protease